ncbi:MULTISPECIES: hypothetical protein [Bacillus]|uniref:hypothetical protein n=1 Tax=Bacillus TaxID=1386 RepID=UPI000BED8616|nr:hypothetical protein [Bacillus toyonensis]MCU5178909.1 hypothetical protein [Bacillus toyonensis]PEA33170.1 hypothetical protein COO13_11290 [Bacillus toyonensis]PEA68404.1 hypothetical protein COO18_02215 [Bacillus toyonensis]PGA41923.1 hypothetical protein COL81_04530 [Bacillus toyonensis]PGC07491.1 hypothetical protein COM20_08570 [Bacillus toyonensis]
MDMKKMIETIETTKVTDVELLISTLHQMLVKLYSEKNVTNYTELLKYILSLSINLKLNLVLKYLGVRPIVASDERMQFQEIFKCLAKQDDNGEWFLNFVSLYVGLIVVLHFDEKEIERSFFDDVVVVGEGSEI